MPKTNEATATAGPVERIGRIAKAIEGSGGRNEQHGRLTPEVVDKLHEQRLFRMLLPRAYGGEEARSCHLVPGDGGAGEAGR